MNDECTTTNKTFRGKAKIGFNPNNRYRSDRVSRDQIRSIEELFRLDQTACNSYSLAFVPGCVLSSRGDGTRPASLENLCAVRSCRVKSQEDRVGGLRMNIYDPTAHGSHDDLWPGRPVELQRGYPSSSAFETVSG